MPEYFNPFKNPPNKKLHADFVEEPVSNNLEWESLDNDTRKKLTPMLIQSGIMPSKEISEPEIPNNSYQVGSASAKIKDMYRHMNPSQSQIISSPTHNKMGELIEVISNLQKELSQMKKQVTGMHSIVNEKDAEIARITQQNKEDNMKFEARIKDEKPHTISEKYNKYLKKAEDAIQANAFESKETSYKAKIKQLEDTIEKMANESQTQEQSKLLIIKEKEAANRKQVEAESNSKTLEKQFTQLTVKYKTEKVGI